MKKILRFVFWICKRFNREEILEIVDELVKVINDENPDIKPKDDFKEKHPNYRNFSTDPLAPLDAADIMKLTGYGLKEGMFADIAILNAGSAEDALAYQATATHVFKRGRLVARNEIKRRLYLDGRP